MKQNVKVNLDCWLASQFKIVLAKKNNPLILGSYITHLTVHLEVLNLQSHDLYLACDMKFLDVVCLEKMGIVEDIDGIF